MSYILIAKPSNHKFLFNCLSIKKQQDEINQLEFSDKKGRRHIYEWINGIPLNGTQAADNVNFFEYTIIADDEVSFYCR